MVEDGYDGDGFGDGGPAWVVCDQSAGVHPDFWEVRAGVGYAAGYRRAVRFAELLARELRDLPEVRVFGVRAGVLADGRGFAFVGASADAAVVFAELDDGGEFADVVTDLAA